MSGPRYRWRLVSYVLLAAFLAWGGAYVLAHLDELAVIRHVPARWVILLFLLASGKFVSQGLFTKIVVKDLGVNLGFPEWLELAALSAMANALTPLQGGAAARAAYLKSRHGLPYSHFLSTLAVLYTVTFAMSAALGAIASILLYAGYGVFQPLLVGLFVLCLIIPGLFIRLVSLPAATLQRLGAVGEKLSYGSGIRRPVGKLLRAMVRVTAGARAVHTSRQTTVRLLGLSLLNAMLSLYMVHVSFAAFDRHLPFLASLVLSNLFMISSLIPLTPSGLGIGELAVVMASQLFGVSTSTSVLSAGLNRSAMLLSSLFWGVLLSHLLDFRGSPTVKTDGESVGPQAQARRS